MTTLLEKLRTLDSFLRKSPTVDFKQIAETLGDLVDAKVYILDLESRILGSSDSKSKTYMLPEKYDILFTSNATYTNIIIAGEICRKFPVLAGKTKFGDIIAIRSKKQSDELTDQDIIILENAAQIIGLKQECSLYMEGAFARHKRYIHQGH